MQAPDRDAEYRWYRSLRVRIILLISLVALPIGLIAVYQTKELAQSADRNAELALLALSDQATQSDRLIVQRALGAARMLGGISDLLLADPDSCADVLSRYLEQEPNFSFASITDANGRSRCSSLAAEFDFSATSRWPDLKANPRANIVANVSAPASRDSVIVVSTPIMNDATFAGYVSISIPHRRLAEQAAAGGLRIEGLVELVTLNPEGEILTAQTDVQTAWSFMPADFETSNVLIPQPTSYRALGSNGTEYVYAVLPMEDSPLIVMGVWDVSKSTNPVLFGTTIPPGVFPALMWLATVLVSIMALSTLLIRNVSRLRHQMVDFATSRKTPEVRFNTSVPNELVDIQQRFVDMTDDILREEARLEAMVREQNILAKEVHHRVKNNLQMVTSIMNMQIRNAEHDETVDTLQRVQNRITSLADVHQDLASKEDEGRVNVASLIQRTVDGSVELGVYDPEAIELEMDVDTLWLYPDQGVALLLLANEAITNALKYMSTVCGAKPKITICLKRDGDDATFKITNTIAPGTKPPATTGIGSRLINAFAIKLGATVDTTVSDELYEMLLTFRIETYESQGHDF